MRLLLASWLTAFCCKCLVCSPSRPSLIGDMTVYTETIVGKVQYFTYSTCLLVQVFPAGIPTIGCEERCLSLADSRRSCHVCLCAAALGPFITLTVFWPKIFILIQIPCKCVVSLGIVPRRWCLALLPGC